MGKGKGDPVTKIFKVRCGTILFEVEGVNTKTILDLLNKAKKKLPIKMKTISAF